MKFPVIRESYFLNIVILLFSLFISWFTLLFGLAHLIDGKNHNIPYSEHIKGVIFCIVLCLIGIVFLLIAFASIQGIIYKIKNKQP
jgi:hypothetical protein